MFCGVFLVCCHFCHLCYNWVSEKHKSASPSASPNPKRKQRNTIRNEGKLDTINVCLIKVYTLLVSAVRTTHGNARKIADSTESVAPASLTVVTQLLSPSPAFLRVCWASHPSPSQTQVWPAPQASLSHLIQLAPFNTPVYTSFSQFHSLRLGWKWMLVVYFYVNISNIIMMCVCVCVKRLLSVWSPNRHLFHYFVRECCVWFMPALSETQPGCETRATCHYVKWNALWFCSVMYWVSACGLKSYGLLNMVSSPWTFWTDTQCFDWIKYLVHGNKCVLDACQYSSVLLLHISASFTPSLGSSSPFWSWFVKSTWFALAAKLL